MLNLDIVSPNIYVNIQSVFWRNRSRAEFGFGLFFGVCFFLIIGLVPDFSSHDCIALCNNTALYIEDFT